MSSTREEELESLQHNYFCGVVMLRGLVASLKMPKPVGIMMKHQLMDQLKEEHMEYLDELDQDYPPGENDEELDRETFFKMPSELVKESDQMYLELIRAMTDTMFEEDDDDMIDVTMKELTIEYWLQQLNEEPEEEEEDKDDEEQEERDQPIRKRIRTLAFKAI